MADENLYRVRAERGDVQIGTWVNMIRTPSVLALLRAAGLDFARIDMEHSPFSMETMADMAALARAMNFPMVVRPPEGNREWITRLLDAGVWNLHVPQVDTPEQAREVAAACRYAPLGERGMYGFGPTTIPNYPVDFTVRQRLVQDAFDLLSKATPDAPHPVAMIDLPTERKVLVAELRDVTSRSGGAGR